MQIDYRLITALQLGYITKRYGECCSLVCFLIDYKFEIVLWTSVSCFFSVIYTVATLPHSTMVPVGPSAYCELRNKLNINFPLQIFFRWIVEQENHVVGEKLLLDFRVSSVFISATCSRHDIPLTICR